MRGDEVDRLGRREPPVQLQQHVNLAAERVAHPAHGLDRAAHVGHVGGEEGLVLALVEEGIDVAHRVETRLLEGDAVLHQLVGGLAVGVTVYACPGPARPAEEGVDGTPSALPLMSQSAMSIAAMAPLMAAPWKWLKRCMRFQWRSIGPGVLAHQMLGEGLDGCARGHEMPPGARFPEPGDARVGLDTYEEELADRDRRDCGDLHGLRHPEA